jgi:hypothetical protein
MVNPITTSTGYVVGFAGSQLEGLTLASHDNLAVADRWDIGRLLSRANQLAEGTAIQRVTLGPAGGSLDLHFVVTDREAGYEAAAPIVRRLLNEFGFLMDFHFVDPSELAGD